MMRSWLVAGVGMTAVWGARWCRRHTMAPARRGWRAPSGRVVRAGPLSVRLLGDSGPVVVLLHGLVGSGLEWGAAWDGLAGTHRLVVPDLLGFGRTGWAGTPRFGAPEHLDALAACLHELGLAGEPLLLVGHSMGGTLALCLGADRLARGLPVAGVAGFCPPLFTGPEEADRVLAASDWINRSMTVPGPLPRLVCRAICGGPWWGKVIYVALNPIYPVPLAAEGVRHCFESYRDSLDGLVRTGGWRPALRGCLAGGVPVLLAGGARDHVVALGRNEELAAQHAGVRAATHPSGGHDLPIAEPEWCLRRMQEVFGV